jgi:hypothetical protein
MFQGMMATLVCWQGLCERRRFSVATFLLSETKICVERGWQAFEAKLRVW